MVICGDQTEVMGTSFMDGARCQIKWRLSFGIVHNIPAVHYFCVHVDECNGRQWRATIHDGGVLFVHLRLPHGLLYEFLYFWQSARHGAKLEQKDVNFLGETWLNEHHNAQYAPWNRIANQSHEVLDHDTEYTWPLERSWAFLLDAFAEFGPSGYALYVWVLTHVEWVLQGLFFADQYY